MKITPTISVVQMPDIKESLQDRIERLIIGKPITNHLKGVIRCLIAEIETTVKYERRDPTDEEKTAIEQLNLGLSNCLIVCPDPEPLLPSTFNQHVPGFCDIDEPIHFTFESQEQLLEHSFVKNWSTYSGFCNYAISYHPKSTKRSLLVITDEGYQWYVIGYINGPLVLDLPIFEPKYRAKSDKGG